MCVAFWRVITITRAGAEALDRLAPLWLLLHEHHPRGRRRGARALRRRRVLLARQAGAVRGLPRRRRLRAARRARRRADRLRHGRGHPGGGDARCPTPGGPARWWRRSRRCRCCRPRAAKARCRAAGLDRRRAGAPGVHDVLIGAFVANAGAIRLYERRGFRPAWVYTSARQGLFGVASGARAMTAGRVDHGRVPEVRRPLPGLAAAVREPRARPRPGRPRLPRLRLGRRRAPTAVSRSGSAC